MPLNPKFATYDAAQQVTDLQVTACGVMFTVHLTSGAVCQGAINFFAQGVVHVELGKGTNPAPIPGVPNIPLIPATVAAVQTDATLHLTSDQLCVQLELQIFRIGVTRIDGETLWTSSFDDLDQKGRLRVLPLGFDDDSRNVTASFSVDPTEHFYGFGEKFTRLDKVGLSIVSANSNAGGATSEASYKNVPFFVSSRGYGVLWNTTTHLQHDVANPALSILSYVVTVDAPCLSFYLLNGPTPKDVLRKLADLSGHAPVPPLWSFGLWASRFYFESAYTLLDVARGYRTHGIPADVINTDTYWMNGEQLSDMQWDKTRFPNPEEMIRELRTLGFQLCLWEYPYLSHASPLWQHAWANRYLARFADGRPADVQTTLPMPTHERPGFRGVGTTGSVAAQRLVTPGTLIDFTHPGAVTWWQALHRPLLEQGVAVFKTDFGEDIPHDVQFHDGRTGREVHNLYPLLYQKAVFDVTKEVTGSQMIWGRSGWAGGQRFPVHWGGDPVCTFSAMAGTLRAGLSYGLSGVPFWSHDIGGFAGTPTPEVFIRWAQFGLLSSHARCHGTTPREPWEFGADAEHIFRMFSKLRYALMPYLYHLAVEAATTGLPLMRAMVLEFPEDPACYTIDTQYMLGSDLLVAPVLHPAGRAEVYLPHGRWYHHFTHEVFEGGRWLQLRDVPLTQMPLFLRAGACLPQVDSENVTSTRDLSYDEVTFEVFADSTVERTFTFPNGERASLSLQMTEDGAKGTFHAVDGRHRLRLHSAWGASSLTELHNGDFHLSW